MNPGLTMVFDPHPGRAKATVSAMIAARPPSAGQQVVAVAGEGWAAGLVPPPVNEPTCAAHVYQDERGILLWTGEPFLPEHWLVTSKAASPDHISKILLDRLTTDGVESLGEVDNQFCGAWHDACNNRWTIFNDRIGCIPVFWGAEDERVVIGPTSWLIWQALETTLTPSDEGVIDVIRAQNSVDDHTLIQSVHWLIGGHALTIEPNRVIARKYWEFRHRAATSDDMETLIDSYVEPLTRSIHRYMTSHDTPMLGLSGGMDSRLVLAAAEAAGCVPECYSTGFSFSEDVRYGRALARAVGAAHEWVPLHDDGIHERMTDLIVRCEGLHGAAHLLFGSALPAYMEQHAGRVVLEGLVYPVAGGGCVPADDDVDPSIPAHQSRWAQSNLHSTASPAVINELLRLEFAAPSYARWGSQIDEKFEEAPGHDALRRAEYVTQSGRSGRNNILGVNVYRRDVQVRHPLCDRLMERWFASAPPTLRRGKQFYMEVIRRRFPHLARVQRTDYNGLPISTDRVRREMCWHGEKARRLWTRLRHPWTRRHGGDGRGARGWGFEAWRATGGLDVLLERDARVLRWVEPQALKQSWDAARQDALNAVPVMTLGTIEIMLRWCEQLPPLQRDASTLNFVDMGTRDGRSSAEKLVVGAGI